MKNKTRQRRAKAPSAPPIVLRLLTAFVSAEKSTIDAAFQHAGALATKSSIALTEDVAEFVEPTAEKQLVRYEAADVMDSEIWGRHAGTIYCAVSDPSFCLGFSLAYLLFTEKGGDR